MIKIDLVSLYNQVHIGFHSGEEIRKAINLSKKGTKMSVP